MKVSKQKGGFIEKVIKTRREWTIKPVTRVHDKDKKLKNKSKRQQSRNQVREARRNYNSGLYFFVQKMCEILKAAHS